MTAALKLKLLQPVKNKVGKRLQLIKDVMVVVICINIVHLERDYLFRVLSVVIRTREYIC